MRTSEHIHELAAALAIAQGQMGGAMKDSEVSVTDNQKRKYADLASVWEACRKPLADNCLAVIQTAGSVTIKERKHIDVKKYDKWAKPSGKEYTVTEEYINATITITTRLVHSSGQWIEEELEMIVVKADPHAIGSAITYGRRYQLAAMAGVYQEDDDGNAAKGLETPTPAAEPQQPAPAAKPAAAPAQTAAKPTAAPAAQPPAQGHTSGHFQKIVELKERLAMSDDDLKFAIKEVLSVERLQGQPPAQFQKLITFMTGLTEENIAFADWKSKVVHDNATLVKSIQGSLPEFPA